MKRNIRIFSKLSLLAFIVGAFTTMVSCIDNDDNNSNDITLTGQTKTYNLTSVSNPAINGTVKFAERSDKSTVVTINLVGTTAGNSHPTHVHANSAVETGDIIIDLNPVDGATGTSETIVTKKKDGTSITYSQFLQLDGYVNVHLSSTNLTTLIAQGDIGGNETTSTFTSYTLSPVNTSGIGGSVVLTKRVNGTTLVKVDLDGASPTGEYPVYIYDNDTITKGSIAIDLNKVNGATGVSYTNVTQLNSGTPITYDQLADFNGHVGVSASPSDLTTFVAQTNIGAN